MAKVHKDMCHSTCMVSLINSNHLDQGARRLVHRRLRGKCRMARLVFDLMCKVDHRLLEP